MTVLINPAGVGVTAINYPMPMQFEPMYSDNLREFDGKDDQIYLQWTEEAPFEATWYRSPFKMGGLRDGEDALDFNEIHEVPKWEYRVWPSGTKARKRFSGITYDSAGAVCPGCIVQLYRSIDESFIAWCYSDTIGYYQLFSPFADEHFLVARKTGTQAIAGATVDTILGA